MLLETLQIKISAVQCEDWSWELYITSLCPAASREYSHLWGARGVFVPRRNNNSLRWCWEWDFSLLGMDPLRAEVYSLQQHQSQQEKPGSILWKTYRARQTWLCSACRRMGSRFHSISSSWAEDDSTLPVAERASVFWFPASRTQWK